MDWLCIYGGHYYGFVPTEDGAGQWRVAEISRYDAYEYRWDPTIGRWRIERTGSYWIAFYRGERVHPSPHRYDSYLDAMAEIEERVAAEGHRGASLPAD